MNVVAGEDRLSSRTATAILFVLAAVVLLAGVGLRDPWPADEPRFAQIAREMVESGRWLFPTRGGELYSDKPPLFMWTVALLYRVTDNLRVAFLLPSALCSLVTLVLLHDLTRRWWNRAVANRAGLLLLVCLQFVVQAKSAQIDAMVAMWIMLGGYGLLRHLVVIDDAHPGSDGVGWWVLGWFAMGLGVITKGVGFLPVFLLLPWVVQLLWRAQPRVAPASVMQLLGPVAFLAAIALWFVPMWLAVESGSDPAAIAYRDDILLRQTAKRYSDSWSHLSPWWYFPVSVIPLFWLPGTALLPWLVRPWIAAVRGADPRILMPLAQVFLVVLFFSLSPGKRGVYVLPALPMFVLAIAPFLGETLARRGVQNVLLAVMLVFGAVFVAIGVAGLLGIDAALEIELDEGVRPWPFALSLGALALAAAWFGHRRDMALGWCVFVLPLWLLWSTWGYALANPARTPADVYRAIGEIVDAEQRIELGLVDFREQYLLFSPYPLTHFGFNTPDEQQLREAFRWLGDVPGDGTTRYLLLADRFDLSCFEPRRAIALEHAHGREWRLYGRDARAPECAAPDVAVPRYRYEQAGALPID